MDAVRQVISAVNRCIKRIWKAIKRRCTFFNIFRRNSSSNSTIECTAEVNVQIVMLDEECKNEKTRIGKSKEDLTKCASVISTTKDEIDLTVNDIEEEQPQYDGEQSDKKSLLFSQFENSNIIQEYEDNFTLSNSIRIPHLSIDDFIHLKLLGYGSFGRVLLCRHKKLNEHFAIKELNKREIIDENEIKSVLTEKRIFILANEAQHPFLIHLFGCFQTDTHLCFVMEYCSAGDLEKHLLYEKFTESRTVFYAACIILGLKYLHKTRIVHCDLKAANILMDADGYVKIADYGICKENVGYEGQILEKYGTPTHMAPEVFKYSQYSPNVDWWALGITIFQMLVGKYPFWGYDIDELLESILNDAVKYPVFLSIEAFDIIRSLTHKDPDRRLGSTRNSKDVKKQTFFHEIDWDDLFNKKVKPPYVPTIISKEYSDGSYEDQTSEELQLIPRESLKLVSDYEKKLFEKCPYSVDCFKLSQFYTPSVIALLEEIEKDSNYEQQSSDNLPYNPNTFKLSQIYSPSVIMLLKEGSNTDEHSTSSGPQLTPHEVPKVLSNHEQPLSNDFSHNVDYFTRTLKFYSSSLMKSVRRTNTHTVGKSTFRIPQLNSSTYDNHSIRQLSDEEQQLFKNFSYTADWFQQSE